MTSLVAPAASSYLTSPGKSFPSSAVELGLGIEQRSIWLGPPCITIEIIAVARGGWWGGLGVVSNRRRIGFSRDRLGLARSSLIAQ